MEAKMRNLLLAALVLLVSTVPTLAADGVINVKSEYGVSETTDRLIEVLNKKGMTIFNRVKHSEGASSVGIELRDTELVIFGNPKVGSPLMQCQQSVAIDLPQKALIWKDEQNHVWISYNDPYYLVKRHSVLGCEEVIEKISKALAGIAKAASET
jgi:uncharacterized protein (DUF302 family)